MFWRLQVPQLNHTQLHDIAPAWVQEPNGRGMAERSFLSRLEDVFA